MTIFSVCIVLVCVMYLFCPVVSMVLCHSFCEAGKELFLQMDIITLPNTKTVAFDSFPCCFQIHTVRKDGSKVTC